MREKEILWKYFARCEEGGRGEGGGGSILHLQEIFLKYFGNILEIFWKYFGNTLEIFWKCFGNILEIF